MPLAAGLSTRATSAFDWRRSASVAVDADGGEHPAQRVPLVHGDDREDPVRPRRCRRGSDGLVVVGLRCSSGGDGDGLG